MLDYPDNSWSTFGIGGEIAPIVHPGYAHV